MSENEEYLSEEAAARVWQRAAELQVEAARRAETRGGGEEQLPAATSDGFALAHVRAAALEAGIGAEFVDAAVADLRAEEAALGDVDPGRKRFARVMLGDPPPALAVRRTVDASAEEVLEAMEEILPRSPYDLRLKDRQGDPTHGGLLVFDIVGATMTPTTEKGFVLDASWADLREVYLSLRPLPDGAVELHARSPVAWAWNINALFVPLAMLVGGGVGLALGAVLGTLLATLLPGSVGAVAGGIAAALASGVGAYGGMAGLRALYRHSLARGRRGLEGLLEGIGVHASGGWGLTARKDPPLRLSDPDTAADGPAQEEEPVG